MTSPDAEAPNNQIFYFLAIKYLIENKDHKGSFQKKNYETYGKFHILGGGQQGVIFHMLSRKILNAQKAILSIFRHFYFFSLMYWFAGQ